MALPYPYLVLFVPGIVDIASGRLFGTRDVGDIFETFGHKVISVPTLDSNLQDRRGLEQTVFGETIF
jgi:hypothetical protein